jgi:hypothetical protein
MNSSLVKKDIKKILKKYSVSNKFSVKFTGTADTTNTVVTIQDWISNPISDLLEKEVAGVGYILVFDVGLNI